MPQHCKTSTEEKIIWLLEHRDLWFGLDLSYATVTGHANYMRLFNAMKLAGLYSPATAAHDAYLQKLTEKVSLPSPPATSNKEKRNGK